MLKIKQVFTYMQYYCILLCISEADKRCFLQISPKLIVGWVWYFSTLPWTSVRNFWLTYHIAICVMWGVYWVILRLIQSSYQRCYTESDEWDFRDGGDVVVVRNGLGGCVGGGHTFIRMREHDSSALCSFSRVNSSHNIYSNMVC